MIIPAYTVHVKISLNLKDLSVVSDDSIIMYIRLLGFQFIQIFTVHLWKGIKI